VDFVSDRFRQNFEHAGFFPEPGKYVHLELIYFAGVECFAGQVFPVSAADFFTLGFKSVSPPEISA
jgi:hypothetical protein